MYVCVSSYTCTPSNVLKYIHTYIHTYTHIHTYTCIPEGIKKGFLSRRKADAKAHDSAADTPVMWRAPRQCCSVMWHPCMDALYVAGMYVCNVCLRVCIAWRALVKVVYIWGMHQYGVHMRYASVWCTYEVCISMVYHMKYASVWCTYEVCISMVYIWGMHQYGVHMRYSSAWCTYEVCISMVYIWGIHQNGVHMRYASVSHMSTLCTLRIWPSDHTTMDPAQFLLGLPPNTSSDSRQIPLRTPAKYLFALFLYSRQNCFRSRHGGVALSNGQSLCPRRTLVRMSCALPLLLTWHCIESVENILSDWFFPVLWERVCWSCE
jgi:hypothetical protein